jgi:tetratricopeptide (TPR) repeat protein
LQYFWDGQFGRAQQEYLATLQLDPDNAEAHFGLGLLAKRQRHWGQSEALLKKAVELEANFLDSYRALGDVLARQGRTEDAMVAYTRALKLALEGHKPRHATIITLPEDDRHLKDPWHFQTYARLAQVHALQETFTEAINLYKMSIAGGNDDPYVKFQLASLYLKTAQWKNALRELNNTVQALLRALWNTQRRLYRRIRRAL